MVGDDAARRRSVSGLIERALSESGLTKREHEVAVLLALGHSNKEIAARLRITGHTARRHTEGVMKKLAVDSRSRIAAHVFARLAARETQ